MKFVHTVMSIVTKYLAVFIVVCSFIAYAWPHYFMRLQDLTGLFLGLIFFFMGITLSTEQILSVIKNPKYAFIGFFLKWTITVGFSFMIAFIFFKNSPELAAGVILSGIVPSGTAANLYTFIAGGEVALSITMATLDTIVSPLMTPSIASFTIGKVIDVNAVGLFVNIMFIVFVPLFLGLFVQWKFPKQVSIVKPYTSIFSQIALLLVVFSVVSKAQSTLQENLQYLPLIFLAVILQVVAPMFIGYFVAKTMKVKFDYVIAITFHTGICNTALSATLASDHISAIAAVPAVANMIVNLTIGAMVARIFDKQNQVGVAMLTGNE